MLAGTPVIVNNNTGGGGGGTINGTIAAHQVGYGASTNTLTSDDTFTHTSDGKTSMSWAQTGTQTARHILGDYSLPGSGSAFTLSGDMNAYEDSVSGFTSVIGSFDGTAVGGGYPTSGIIIYDPSESYGGSLLMSQGSGNVTLAADLRDSLGNHFDFTFDPSNGSIIEQTDLSGKSAKLFFNNAGNMVISTANSGSTVYSNISSDYNNGIGFQSDLGNWYIPKTAPSTGQVLGYVSAGQTGWVTPSAGGTIGGSIAATQVAFGGTTANTINGSNNLTWDGVTFYIADSLGKGIASFAASTGDHNVHFGDLSLSGNKTTWNLDDATSTIAANANNISFYTTGRVVQMGSLSYPSSHVLVKFGDVQNADGGTLQTTDVGNQTFSVTNNTVAGGYAGLKVDFAGAQYLLGAKGFGNGTYINADDTNGKINLQGTQQVRVKRVNVTYSVAVGDYFLACDSSTGAFTITLPASPVQGDTYIVKDATGFALTKNITVDGNGNNIDGSATDVLATNYAGRTYTFVTSLGWSVS
jgi:hypothetical protein